ncbi:MAG TPA: tol-pal system protein YbgF [Proteobacteria bacterium]|nr:tol-pal system protein YbgF [Pseudomonadota bacterium]
MKSYSRHTVYLLFLLPAFLAGGCVSTDQPQEHQALIRRLTNVEQQQAALTRRTSNELQKLNADTGIRLDNLERELRLLSETVEDSLSRPVETKSSEQIQFEAALKAYEERLQKIEKAAGISTTAAAADSPLPANPQPVPTILPQPQPGAREKALYDDAYASFKKGDLKTAQDKFNKFISAFPNSSYKVNAQFWIGECFYKAKDYAEAIIKYDEIIAKHPDHPKAPSALLKQGFAFLELGDATDGKLILEKVIANYPESEQAEIARRKLSQ